MMALPPDFLDEIRARLAVSEICGRRVQLKRRGREFVGLSPFNSEKTPSFTVNDEKGFYHCFSSGKHGDIFSFVMETEGLSFPEAVEKLAAEAGLDVPRTTPEQRAREERRAGLHDVVDAACTWFEKQLHGPRGREALAYLTGRGLDDATIRRFRLGFAPEGGGLQKALAERGFDEAMLVECGLLRRSDDGRSSYPFFRGRVMFPIADRRDRVIAFGGRLLGDAKAAKYINSPDTPLFDKGRTLYNLAGARQAAHDGHELIVTEGYMDVIALAVAGLKAAVAPLGTALTERQIEELWRLAPEPILCFDGDAAGERAAFRAVERVLPLLKPGRSLRFAYLPAGEDPDSLVCRHGRTAMLGVLGDALPLAEIVWRMEAAARPLDTPERRADFESRLRRRVAQITDRTVQRYYDEMLRSRLWRSLKRSPGRSGRGRSKGADPHGIVALSPHRTNLSAVRRMRQRVMLAAFINHPQMVHRYCDVASAIEFEPDLDKIRQEIHEIMVSWPDLDSAGLKRHLTEAALFSTLQAVLDKEVLVHAAFAREDADPAVLEGGFRDLLGVMLRDDRRRELLEQGRRAGAEGTADSEARFLRFHEEIQRAEIEIAELDD